MPTLQLHGISLILLRAFPITRVHYNYTGYITINTGYITVYTGYITITRDWVLTLHCDTFQLLWGNITSTPGQLYNYTGYITILHGVMCTFQVITQGTLQLTRDFITITQDTLQLHGKHYNYTGYITSFTRHYITITRDTLQLHGRLFCVISLRVSASKPQDTLELFESGYK